MIAWRARSCGGAQSAARGAVCSVGLEAFLFGGKLAQTPIPTCLHAMSLSMCMCRMSCSISEAIAAPISYALAVS